MILCLFVFCKCVSNANLQHDLCVFTQNRRIPMVSTDNLSDLSPLTDGGIAIRQFYSGLHVFVFVANACRVPIYNMIYVSLHRIEEKHWFQRTTFPIFLLSPTVGIAIICFVIIAVIKKRSNKNVNSELQAKEQRKEKQAVIQLVLIIIAFLIGYIPFTGTTFISILVIK